MVYFRTIILTWEHANPDMGDRFRVFRSREKLLREVVLPDNVYNDDFDDGDFDYGDFDVSDVDLQRLSTIGRMIAIHMPKSKMMLNLPPLDVTNVIFKL